MNKPDVGDRIRCPESNDVLSPDKVWDSTLPDGKRVRYGIYGKHNHGGEECWRSGLPAQDPVFPANKTD